MAGTARGGNAQDMKTRNRLLVLQMLCTYGPLSRGEIAARAGLSKMTATNIISDLETAGLIAEEKGESAGAGRRPGLIRLSPASPLVCGITIGRRRCEAVLADLSAQIVARESACYDNALDGPRLSELLARLCSRLLKRADRPVVGVGRGARPARCARRHAAQSPQFLRYRASARARHPFRCVRSALRAAARRFGRRARGTALWGGAGV